MANQKMPVLTKIAAGWRRLLTGVLATDEATGSVSH
jgi:hypothetical protein